MEKSEILEAILCLINEEIDQALNEDEALRMSDERRKKFKDTVFSNPPAYNSAGSLKEAPEPPPPAPEAPTEPNDAPAPAMGEPSDGMAGAEMPDASGGMDPAAAGGDMGGGGSGEMPADGEDPAMDDAGGDMGGGGDMMGGFGGGGGGGMDLGGGEDGEGGGEGETADNPPPSSFNPFEDAESLEDKLQVILDTAEEIAEKTQDPQKVLKAVKGLIQNGFENPDQAARAISDLFDTNNPVLQQVSRRLALFTYGV